MGRCSTADGLEARAHICLIFDDSTPYSLPTEDDSLPATSSTSTLLTEPSPRNAAKNENESNNLDQSKGCEQ